MPKAFRRAAESWRYVLRRDRDLPLEQQSVFVLRPMTLTERAAAHDDMARVEHKPDGGRLVLARTRQQAVAIVLSHVVSTDRFPLDAPAPWPPDPAAQLAYLEQLEDADVDELGDEIWYHSTVDARSALGNSSPPERTSTSGGDSAATISTTAQPATPTPP